VEDGRRRRTDKEEGGLGKKKRGKNGLFAMESAQRLQKGNRALIVA